MSPLTRMVNPSITPLSTRRSIREVTVERLTPSSRARTATGVRLFARRRAMRR